jgi:hypothetical protein
VARGGRARAGRAVRAGRGAPAGLAALVGLAALAGLAACEPEAGPRFAATCAPDATMEQVTCRIHNHGKRAGRACFTARVQPVEGTPFVAQRVCTGVLSPGHSLEAKPAFELLDRTRRDKAVAARCLQQGRWTCKIDVVETPDEMLQNQP